MKDKGELEIIIASNPESSIWQDWWAKLTLSDNQLLRDGEWSAEGEKQVYFSAPLKYTFMGKRFESWETRTAQRNKSA